MFEVICPPFNNEFIFVYGTLRKETATAMAQLLERHGEYLYAGVMQGRLYEVDGYPGAVESLDPADKVFGDLYQIVDRDILLSELDVYEECSVNFPEPHEYVRKQLPVLIEHRGSVTAWVYLYNRPVFNLRHLVSGDYLNKR